MGRKRSELLVPLKGSGISEWQQSLREAVYEGISQDDVKGIVKKIVEQAKCGDEVAIKMVFDYLLGGCHQPRITNNNVIIQTEDSGGPPNGRASA